MAERTPIDRDLGSLAFSCVRVEKPLLGLRAFHWQNVLLRLGASLPFWIVHDLGMLMVLGPDEAPIGPRPGVTDDWEARAKGNLEAYSEGLREVAQSEMLQAMRRWSPSDDLIAVLLVRILRPISEQVGEDRPSSEPFPMNPNLFSDIERRLGAIVPKYDYGYDYTFMASVARSWLSVVIAIEQVDLDTLQLLGMFGLSGGATGSLGILDLLEVMEQPEANDVVNFSLDLLPSVLETKRSSGQQTYSVDGYSGVSRRGSVDSMVFSELAFDPDLFARRFAEKEIFYYAREKQREEARRLHYIVIDASASMRGQRTVFARGLALTLAKKLLLTGDEAYLRFFDSTLYEIQRAIPHRGPAGGLNIPQILTFKGEHGRNYAKVFTLLAGDLRRLKDREGIKPILYLITHGECHIPLHIVDSLAASATLYGIFMLPSQGKLDLAYLPQLDTVQVVEEANLYQRDARATRALSIVDDAAGTD